MASTLVYHVAVFETTCRDRVASAGQQVAASRQAGGAPGLGDQAAEEAALPLEAADIQQRLLPLLLPGASQEQLAYAAAMLLPFASGSLPMSQLAAAAAECAAVERRLRERAAGEAARCLLQLATALGSRSLDLAAAFAAAQGHQLPYPELVSRQADRQRQTPTFACWGCCGASAAVCSFCAHCAVPPHCNLLCCREGCCSGCSRGCQKSRHAAYWQCWLHRPAPMAAAAAAAAWVGA
jgi:hypothetical protein